MDVWAVLGPHPAREAPVERDLAHEESHEDPAGHQPVLPAAGVEGGHGHGGAPAHGAADEEEDRPGTPPVEERGARVEGEA